VVVAVSILLGSAFGIAVLALLWWRSMPAHDQWLTLWIGLCFWFAALIGLTGFLTARAQLAGAARESAIRARSDHPGQRVPVGDGNGGKAKLGGTLNHLLRMRGPGEEGEIGGIAEFGIGHVPLMFLSEAVGKGGG
jgi:hypothetical protein